MSRNLTARYAAVTSTAALVVALGGAGYASGLIGTSQIKNNAVTSAKIKDNAVTGRDVNEGSLGAVPRARTLGGIQGFTIDYHQPTTDSGVKILGAGPLTITATCTTGNTVTVVATSTTKASIYAQTQNDGGSTTSVKENDTEGLGLPAGSPFDLLNGDNGNIDLVTFWYDNATGATITGSFSVDDNDLPGCVVQGHAFLS